MKMPSSSFRPPLRHPNRRRLSRLFLISSYFLLTPTATTTARSPYSSVSPPTINDFLLPATIIASTYLAASSIKIISTGNECLIERLGKYNRRLGPGFHLVLPRPIERVSFEVSTREQVLDVPPQQCYTRDNAPIKADAVVFLRIINAVKARYEVDDVWTAILNLCLTQLREEVGKLTLDESFSSRDLINRSLLDVLNGVCRGWGVEITRVEIQSLEPSPDILAAMELQMAAERKKRASVLKSEGERTTLVNQAEGNAKALLADAQAKSQSIVMEAKANAEKMTLEARAVKSSIETISQAMMKSSSAAKNILTTKEAVDAALQFLMLSRYMETQAKFASANGTKVLMFPTKDSLPLTYEGLSSLMK